MVYPKSICLLFFFSVHINASDQLAVYLFCDSFNCEQHKASWLAYSGINIEDNYLKINRDYVLIQEEDKKALLPIFSQLGKIIPQYCWLINNFNLKQEIFEYIGLSRSRYIDSHTRVTSGLVDDFNFYYITNNSLMYNSSDSNNKKGLAAMVFAGVAAAVVAEMRDVAIMTLLRHPAGWGAFAVGGGIYFSYPLIKHYWATRTRRANNPAYPLGRP